MSEDGRPDRHPAECLTVGHVKISPLLRGGFWLQKDNGAAREILPGVLEGFVARMFREETT